jgi:serine/threonine-protein kinase
MAFDLHRAIIPALKHRYQVEEAIGRGGVGLVCRAREIATGREVALKALWPELAKGIAAKRFLREIEIQRQLIHPNLLPLLDSGLVEIRPGLEIPWMTTPYLPEPTLARLIRDSGRLGIERACEISGSVAAGLESVHNNGYVHRDIKPSNILFSGSTAVLADFGLTRALAVSGPEKVSTTGLLVGTPEYASPEQSRGESVLGPRSDLYSLGIVLYEMLAGEPPFTGRTPQAVTAKHQQEPVPRISILRPDTPPSLEALMLRLMGKTPEERPASAKEVSEAILTL